jgi:PAS domain-containing protein
MTPLRSDLSHDVRFYQLLTDSHARVVGTPLIDESIYPNHTASWLYAKAPFCLLVHNTDPDPCFIYANAAAQACFEYSWAEFTSLPSRLSAEMPDREERQRLLDAVAHRGFIDDYRGLRIAKSGRRFWIENVTVWEIIDWNGRRHGQAARFTSWRAV